MHLLKYRYQPERRSNSWLSTIVEQRRQIEFILDDSPSLQSYLPEIFDKCYLVARRDVAIETGLPASTFPEHSPFSLDDTLNTDFLPD